MNQRGVALFVFIDSLIFKHGLIDMENKPITFVINGNAYSLCATDTEAIRKIPTVDRQELISLLDAVKKQDELALAALERRINKAKISAQAANPASVAKTSTGQTLGEEARRLGGGDVDNLMAKLMLEEKRNQKALPTKDSLYKWMAIFIAVVVLLFLIF